MHRLSAQSLTQTSALRVHLVRNPRPFGVPSFHSQALTKQLIQNIRGLSQHQEQLQDRMLVGASITTLELPFMRGSTKAGNLLFQQGACFSSLVCKEGAMDISFPAATALQAVLFDIDGTLCDSDPLHYYSFREMLQEVGFQGGVPITEEFFIENISGRENFYIGLSLFPDWEQDRRDKFLFDKEARFRSIAAQQLKPVEGLDTLCKWIEKRGLKRAAVTNAPRANAELMTSLLGLSSFFEVVVVGGECERAKPYPDPYQKALKHFGLQPDQAFVLEDSETGIRAAVAAGVAAVGVATRNPEQSLIEAGATFVIHDFNDEKLWKALGTQPDKALN
ncbi:hypothetical protein GOP47_0002930 [Adiantum capillus-veneris]|uniref:Haloacid dehalogenase-like hydrolase domain-containing protein Sgpp n=1 Tax=Adiantum capillus-veneris TaxID=13818 RepID=A0A9D4VD00_ADICA|nr:hypothetical protein GOP47_0002930 [Adiantum capillus-veneris]